jgi:hypothetical protein
VDVPLLADAPLVLYLAGYSVHQDIVIYPVKEFCQVKVNSYFIALFDVFLHLFYPIMS